MEAKDLESRLELRPETAFIFWPYNKIPKVIGFLSGNGLMYVVSAFILFLFFSSE